MNDSFLAILYLYANSISEHDLTTICPVFVFSKVTDSTTSFISPPYAPAFINTPPPTDPGIPEANSSPLNEALYASFATLERSAPASAVIVSSAILIEEKCFPSSIITPL